MPQNLRLLTSGISVKKQPIDQAFTWEIF